MSCLSPSNGNEYEMYLRKVSSHIKPAGKAKKRNNADANYLSCITLIETNFCYFLLTSDATSFSLNRIKNEPYTYFDKSKPIFGFQIPHHGSENNHEPEFWKYYLLNDSFAFLSAGNNEYGHPNYDVVEYFGKLVLDVYSTNNIYGFYDYCKNNNKNFYSSSLEYSYDISVPEDLLLMANLAQNPNNHLNLLNNGDKVFCLYSDGKSNVSSN